MVEIQAFEELLFLLSFLGEPIQYFCLKYSCTPQKGELLRMLLCMSAPSAWDYYPLRMGSVCSVDSVWKNFSRRRCRPTQTLRNFAPLRETQKKFCVFPWVLCETFNGTPQTHAEFYSSRKGAKYREACVRLFFRHKYWIGAPKTRVEITIDNLIAVAPNSTDPSAFWAPPLTLGRNFIYISSLVIPNWIPKWGKVTKIVPKS